MNITLNNQIYAIQSRTIAAMIEELSIETKGVAIALNNKVTPRAEWDSAALTEGDKVVIVSAVFGG